MNGTEATSVQDDVRATGLSSSGHQTAVRVAVVSGALSALVCTLLALNSHRSLVSDPLASTELKKLKAELGRRPEEESLKLRIRKLDLRLRREYFRQREFSRKAVYLFLGSVVLFFISTQFAASLRKRLPRPQPGKREAWDMKTARLTRGWVSGLGALLATTALAYALRPEVNLAQGFTAATPAASSGQAGESASYPSAEEVKKNWPSFRGPQGAGNSAYSNIPSSWNGETGQGVLWKSPIPLSGHNSPIVWGDRIFVSGANQTQHEVYCYDANTGKPLWRAPALTGRGKSQKGPTLSEETGYAASTMATDGQRVFAIFATGVVAGFDFQGKKLWSRDLGVPENPYGHASSLVAWRNLLFLLFDQGTVEQSKSKLLAINTQSGQTVWEKKRLVSSSWTSPILVDTGKGEQLITCGNPWVIAYDPATGKECWKANCLDGDVAPSPVCSQGQVYAIAPDNKLVALRLGGQGDVSKTHVAWTADEGIPDVCSPVSNGDLVFVLTSSGMLTCYDAKNGKKVWEQSFEANFRSSPSLAGDKLYLFSEEGVTFIVEAARQYKELGKAKLGDPCYACPAFADGRIFVRGKKSLYCLGK